MPEFLEIFFVRTWWKYTPDDGQWFTAIYHWFNLAEGCVWVACSWLVFRRFRTHRQSRSEIVYAIAFLTFAVTDFAHLAETDQSDHPVSASPNGHVAVLSDSKAVLVVPGIQSAFLFFQCLASFS